MEKADLLESLRTLAEAVDMSCKADEPKDAGEIVQGILDETDINCAYETVRKIVSTITHYSDSTKMSFAKCLKDDGWADNGWASGECNGAVLNLKVAELGVPMAREAQNLYNGLGQKQKELLLSLVTELIPLLLQDEDVHVNGIEDIVDSSDLEEWAEENDWKHPDKDSIDDFVDSMPSSSVRDWVVDYIESNL